MPTPMQNTGIILCRQLPVDRDNYPWFGTTDGAIAFARAYQKEELRNYSISPRYPNAIGIAKTIDWFEGVNFVVFRNADFDGRWTFGRITQTAYQSAGSTLVSFEVDHFLTWLGEFKVNECYVEREHCDIAEDLPELQTAPEGLETGPYKFTPAGSINPQNQYVYLYAAETSQGLAGGFVVDGIYYGCVVARQPLSNVNQITAEIDAFAQAGKLDSIIGVYQGPEFGDTMQMCNRPTQIDGYTPKNAKLFNYPYCFLQVSNNQGSEARLRYELSNSGTIGIRVASVGGANGCALAYPVNYAGVDENFDCGVIMKDYPVTPFVGDAYANWSAQNRMGNIAGVAGSVVGVAAGAATANPFIVAGSMATLAGSVGKIIDHSTMPDQARGHMGGSYLNAKYNRFNFVMRNAHVTADMAKRIDDYFSRYGYKTNRLKKPNLDNRPVWNYVKTADCNIWGWPPPEAKEYIKETFNRGVTLWKNGQFVGDFWRDNR